MRNWVRFTAVFLILAVAIGCMVSCKNKKGEGATSESVISQELDLSGEAAEYLPEIENYDREFVMLVSENGSGDQYYYYVNEDENYSGEAISNALYGRELINCDYRLERLWFGRRNCWFNEDW